MSECCQKAVLRAYSELRELGEADLHAFHAAVTVYRYHHPERPPREAVHSVSEWISDALGQ